MKLISLDSSLGLAPVQAIIDSDSGSDLLQILGQVLTIARIFLDHSEFQMISTLNGAIGAQCIDCHIWHTWITSSSFCHWKITFEVCKHHKDAIPYLQTSLVQYINASLDNQIDIQHPWKKQN